MSTENIVRKADIPNNLTRIHGKLKIELQEDGLHGTQVEQEPLTNLPDSEDLQKSNANTIPSKVKEESSKNCIYKQVSTSLLKDAYQTFLSASLAVQPWPASSPIFPREVKPTQHFINMSYFCQYLIYCAEPAKHQFQSKISEIGKKIINSVQRKEELVIRSSPECVIKPKLASSFDTPLPSDEIQTQLIDSAPAQHEKDAILCSPIQMMCALNILKLCNKKTSPLTKT